MSKVLFAPSLMCMDFLRMREQLEVLNRRADLLHVDIMDGHFCKNITLSPDMIRTFAKVATVPMDVHFMTTNPSDWLEVCAQAGAKVLSPHAETINVDAFRTMNLIEKLGCKPGLTLNPATPVDTVRHYIERVHILTIMTVDVGFAGQPFIEQMLGKIEEAAELKARKGYQYLIQIDGSCNERTYKRLVDAGAEVLIVGTSGLFNLHPDLDTAYDMMLAAFAKATAK
jgi:D-allulose-6-phosphate 3-epimerase